jgi:hypothetical protein
VSTWRVSYEFVPPIAYGGGQLSSGSASLKLNDAGTQIIGAEHVIEMADGCSRDEARAASFAEMDALLSALRYLQLSPFRYWSDAIRISPPESGLRFTGRADGTVGGRPVQIPPAVWPSDAPLNLTTWLRLASDAQEAASPATALRAYAIILEDIIASGHAPISDYDCIKAVRDFVSHAKVDRPKTVAKLKECAPNLVMDGGAYRFQPSSSAQSQIVAEWCQRARSHVDLELTRLLGLGDATAYSEG